MKDWRDEERIEDAKKKKSVQYLHDRVGESFSQTDARSEQVRTSQKITGLEDENLAGGECPRKEYQ